MFNLASPDDLAKLAERVNAPDVLAEIVVRLLLASSAGRTQLRFPMGKGHFSGGWDGVFECEYAELVPNGRSYWELSTKSDCKQKADEDYEKRTNATPESERLGSTLVLCTLRRWSSGEKWAQKRDEERKWAQVCVFDADRLFALLVANPGVHLLVSRLADKTWPGAFPAEIYWANWSTSFDPILHPDVLLVGFHDQRNRLVQLLSGNSHFITVQWESSELAAGFVCATLLEAGELDARRLFQRCVIVQNEQVFDELCNLTSPLILITNVPPQFPGAARRNGHKVVLCVGRSYYAEPDVKLHSRHSDVLDEAMREWQPNEGKRRSLVDIGRKKFLSVVHRAKQTVAPPGWDRGLAIRFLLLGRWANSNRRDRIAVEEMTGHKYDDVERLAANMAREDDPLLRRIHDGFCVIDHEQSWSFLKHDVSDVELRKLESCVQRVFGVEIDPILSDGSQDVPVEVSGLESKLDFSDDLRSGLAAAVCYLGVYGAEINVDGSVTGQQCAQRIVRKLLREARTRKMLAAMAPWFPDLAEASPEEFLGQLEDLLETDPDLLRDLFQDSRGTSGFFSSSSPHSNLLWALERLCWSEEYFPRAAKVLLELSVIDPGGQLGNRPLVSLTSSLMPGFPCTTASLDVRLEFLRSLRGRLDQATWDLLLRLMPENQSGFVVPHGARFQPWGVLWRSPVTQQEYAATIGCVVEVAVVLAGTSAERWADLARCCPTLPFNQFTLVLDRLDELIDDTGRTDFNSTVWVALRDTIAGHESHPDAYWAMDDRRLNRIRQTFYAIGIDDPVVKSQWMFSDHAIFDLGPSSDWRAKEKELLTRREAAVKEVFESRGLEGILQLGQEPATAWLVGRSLGQAYPELEFSRTFDNLCDAGPVGADIAHGVLVENAIRRGCRWIADQLSSEWGCGKPPAVRARMLWALWALPLTGDLLDVIEETDGPTQAEFWSRPGGAILIDDPSHLEHVVTQLVRFKSIRRALDTLALCLVGRPDFATPELVLRALEESVSCDRSVLQPISREIGQLIDWLSSRPEPEVARIYRLEVGYSDVLSPWRVPSTTQAQLLQDPKHFVELISAVFLPDSDQEISEPAPTPLGVPIDAGAALNILWSLNAIPGRSSDELVDRGELFAWFEAGKSEAAKAHRTKHFMEEFGRLLANSPSGSDNLFPCEPVRDLIESEANQDLETGIYIGILNLRGAYSRDPESGGDQERALAEQYERMADGLHSSWPRTANLLRSVAKTYREMARREDLEAEGYMLE